MSLVVSNYVFCHSYSFFSDLFHTITLGVLAFPPVFPVNYAVSIVLVLISGGRASEKAWDAKSHLLDLFVLLADRTGPLFDYSMR
jgi:hypothetical protein